jgi:hypothetical protein
MPLTCVHVSSTRRQVLALFPEWAVRKAAGVQRQALGRFPEAKNNCFGQLVLLQQDELANDQCQ